MKVEIILDIPDKIYNELILYKQEGLEKYVSKLVEKDVKRKTGTRNKLTIEEVEQIRLDKILDPKLTLSILADKYNSNKSSIWKILKNISYMVEDESEWEMD